MALRIEPFTRGELDKIHGATVRVLEETGVRVLEHEAVRLLTTAGAAFDPETNLVTIPESVLKECIFHAPRRFKLYGRGSDRVMAFGEGRTYMSSMGTAVNVEDLDGEIRPSTLKDVENFYRLTDALPYLDHSSWVVWPRDVPEDVAHVHEILLGFKHTTKSIDGYNWGHQFAQDTIEMATIVAGGVAALHARPLLLGFVNPVSPLTLMKETTEGLILFAKYGQPTAIPPECMAGGTSPATLAGLLVQQNAEVLAGVAVAECARRGAPVLYGSASTIMDMRTGNVALGAPEAGLIMLGTAQMARYYGIPSRGTGGNTEAITTDFQAGAETSTTLLLAALAGFDFIYDAAGSLESSLTAGYTKLISDHEVCGEVKRIVSGIDVSDDSLAVDVIKAAGLAGGYLSHPHTLKSFKREHFLPSLFRRTARAGTDGRTEKSLWGKARIHVEEILRDHVVDPPLDQDVERQLVEYVKSVHKRHASRPEIVV